MAPKGKAEAAAGKAAPKKEPKKEKKEEDAAPAVEPPDRKDFDAEMLAIQEKINGFQKEQSELATKISERSGGKEDYFEAKKNYRAQLDEFSEKINELAARQQGYRTTMDDKRKEGVDMRSQLNKMKKSIGYNTETEIDQRIHDIEFRMVSESLTLKEEKDCVKEIQDLKRKRPNIRQMHTMEDDISSRDQGVNLKENISQLREEMNLYKDGKKQVAAKLAELNESRQEVMGDYTKLIDQRKALGEKIKEQMDIRNVLREEFRQKEREFNQWRNEERRKKTDKIIEEKAARVAERDRFERAKKAEKLDMQPYVTEITLIEQTIFFCHSLTGTKEVKEEVTKPITHNNPEGTEVLVSRKDREQEYLLPPTSKKKKGKNARSAGKETGSKPIKHNAETFKLFDQLKLNAPITTEDIPATLEKLEEQLASYKEKVSAWEKNRDEMKQKILAGEEVEDGKAAPKEEEAAEESKEEKKDDE